MNQKDSIVKELLIKTLNTIRTAGWCQGQYTNWAGAHCLYGAIDHNSGLPRFRLSWGEVCEAFGMVDPISWNDVPGRTQQEVEQALEKAIAKVS